MDGGEEGMEVGKERRGGGGALLLIKKTSLLLRLRADLFPLQLHQ